MKMPFGKYKGQEIDTLSYGYCSTLLAKIPIKSVYLREALEANATRKLNMLRNKTRFKPIPNSEWYVDWEYEGDDGLDFGDLC